LIVRIKRYKFWVSIFAFHNLSKHDFLRFDHHSDHSCKRALIFSSPNRQDHINALHKMMAWYLAFFAKTQHFELSLDVAIQANTDVFMLNVILGS